MAENSANKPSTSFFKRLAGSPAGGGDNAKPPSKKPNLDGADGVQGNEETTVKTEEDAEVMSGNLSVEVVEKIASKHVKNTYAGATSKPKVDMKNLVYVQKGRERRAPIKGLFMAFMSRMHYNMWNLPAAEFEKINIDWTDHHLGRGLVACMDLESTAYVKKEADTFQKEGETVRAWLKHEFGIQTTYQGFLHSEIWGTYKGPAAITWILKKNGLIENGKFQVLCYQKHKNGVFCRFECDDELAAAIDSHGHTLRAGICRVILKKKVITPTFAGSAEAEAETGEDQQRSSTV